MTYYSKFRADLWTVQMNYEDSGSLTTQTDDELLVTGTFRTNSDIVGLYWNSEDIIKNPYIRYDTSYDYTGITLEFDVSYTGTVLHLDDRTVYPALAVWDIYDNTYFIAFVEFTQDGTHYTIDFDNLVATSYKNKQGELFIGDVQIDPTKIKNVEIPLMPPDWIEEVYTITEHLPFTFKMTNITVTGENKLLNEENEYIENNPYRICEGYDDTYSFAPRRLAHEMRKLGYKDWIDIYIGASHFYEKAGVVGQSARKPNKDPDYNSMYATEGLNNAFRVWWKDYVHHLKRNDTPNIVCSISMENLQIKPEWRQRLGHEDPNNRMYGQTGWTPGTWFYSPCNMEAREFIEGIARECLDIMVEEGVTPILQWGEPWWWWQEWYPESISNDPDNQESNLIPFPNNPPAFYDDATLAKFRQEMGREMPLYTSSWVTDYDTEVLSWLRRQLFEYSEFMKGIVKSYEGGLYTILYFPPYILDKQRVPKMMQYVNYPVEALSANHLDFIQLEDYDWVVEHNAQHDQIYSFAQNELGYPTGRVHYYGGYVQYPKNAVKEWGYIKTAIEEAIDYRIPEVYVWSGTQVRRDSIMLTKTNTKYVPEYELNTSESSNKTFNIIILNNEEEVITWLDPDIVEITEISSAETVRRIELTVPLPTGYAEEEPWFNQGNKIYIPDTMGISSCLYVINTSYNIDYIKSNLVTVSAEEVLTELNNEVIALYPDDPIKVTDKELKEWFGNYYKIGEIDEADTNKRTINPYETLTLMDLLRLIEEKTERVFVTEYISEGNLIERVMHLKKETSLRRVAKTEYLDLNRNLQSLELEVSEEDTYTGVAPILSRQSDSTTQSNILESTSSLISASESLTSNDIGSKEDAKEIMEAWRNHEVQYREYIPMICEKQSDGSVNYPAYWYAPFEKHKGELYVNVPYDVDSSYPTICPPYAEKKKLKLGTVSTSETDVNAIYNVCANKLLDKLHPVFTLKLDVADIQDVLGVDNLGYTLYETLYVRPPRFTYFIPCYITGTEKDPHQPGLNKITIATDVKGFHEQKPTEIVSNDIITTAQEKNTTGGGLLLTEGTAIPNALINVSVRLVESYNEIDYKLQQQTLKFDPVNETYTCTDDEIQKLEQAMYKDITTKRKMSDYYNMRSVDGKIYAVPVRWAEAIYNTRNQHYINTDNHLLNAGKFKPSITVHYYNDNVALLKEKDDILYYPSRFYDHYTEVESEYKKKGFDHVQYSLPSSEKQNGPNCLPSAISNASAYFKTYKTEGQLKTIFGTTSTGTRPDMVLQGLEKLGWTYSAIPITKANIKNRINSTRYSLALLLVNARGLGYDSDENHAVILGAWYQLNGVLYCEVWDSNKPVYDPSQVGKYKFSIDSFVDADTLIRASTAELQNGKLQSLNRGVPVMVVLEPPEMTVEEDLSDVAKFEPNIKSYTFTQVAIQEAYQKLIKTIQDTPTKDYFAENYIIADKDGTKYQMSGKWLLSTAYAMMFYYRHNWDYKSNLTVQVGTGTDSEKYYNHMETDYNWYSPNYPESQNHQPSYVLSTILFRAGVAVPPSNAYSVSDDYVSFQDMLNAINGHSLNKLYCFIVDATKQNVQKYLTYAPKRSYGLYPVQIILPVYSSYIQEVIDACHGDRHYDSYRVSLNVLNGNTCYYEILEANGNSPTNRYDVTYQDIRNPVKVTSIDEIMNIRTNNGLQAEDKNKMLVVSMFPKETLEEWYTNGGQT